MDDLHGLAMWALLFVALNWTPSKVTLRDRLLGWRTPRTDP